MKLLLNQLPTRTWNRLNMNEAQVELEGNFERMDPQVLAKPDKACWQPQGQDLGIRGDLTEILQDVEPGAAGTAEQMEEPLILHYHLAHGRKAMAKLCLRAEKNSRLQVVVLLTGEGSGTLALQQQVLAEEGSRVELYVANLMGSTCRCINHIASRCEADARFDLIRLELGAQKLYSGVNAELAGTGSEFYTDIGYHCVEGQSMDMNYVSAHKGKKTNCLMEISGVLEENSRKTFRGTIDFQRGCAGAKGTENENVLLMGEEMVNGTLPVILCQEEDVEGNHGASIGQLDEKVLFYLGSRGISQDQAKKIIAQARIQAVCARFPSQEIRDRVQKFIDDRGTCHAEL